LKSSKKENLKPCVVVHADNPSMWEAEAGGLQVQGQLGLHSMTLSQKQKRTNNLGGFNGLIAL
jgi:hypothetical protein